MNRNLFLIIAIGLFTNHIHAQSLTPQQIDQLSYGTGVLFYNEFTRSMTDPVNPELCIKGLKDGLHPDIVRLKNLDYLEDSLIRIDDDLVAREDIDQIQYARSYKFTANLVRHGDVSLSNLDIEVIGEAVRTMNQRGKLRYNDLECINAYQAYFRPIEQERFKKTKPKTYRYDLSYAYGESLGSTIKGGGYPVEERYVAWMIKGLQESFSIDTMNGLRELHENKDPKNRWTKSLTKFYSILRDYREYPKEKIPFVCDTLYYCTGLSSNFGRDAQLQDMTFYKQDFDFDVVTQAILDYTSDTTKDAYAYETDSILTEYALLISERSYRYGEAFGRYFGGIDENREEAARYYYSGGRLAQQFKKVPSKYQSQIITSFEKGLNLGLVHNMDAHQVADQTFDQLGNLSTAKMNGDQLSEWAYASGVSNYLTLSYYYTEPRGIPVIMEGFKAVLDKKEKRFTSEASTEDNYLYIMTEREKMGQAHALYIAAVLSKHDFTKEEQDVDKLLEGVVLSLTTDSMTYKKAEELVKARLDSKEPSSTPTIAKELALAYGITRPFGAMVYAGVAIDPTSINFTSFKNAYQSFLSNDSLPMTLEEASNIVNNYYKGYYDDYKAGLKLKRKRYNAKRYASVIKASTAFMKAQIQRKGVIKTEYDNCYEILKEGTEDRKPDRSDTITVVCKATTYDGKSFEDPVLSNDTKVTIAIDQLDIDRLQYLIEEMTVGSKYRFYIKSEDAYYLEGLKGQVLPGAAVIYEIELLDIKPYQEMEDRY